MSDPKPPKLIEKYNNGAVHGYLTDDEALELLSMCKKAYNFAMQLDAGMAVELYYLNLLHRVESLARARKLIS